MLQEKRKPTKKGHNLDFFESHICQISWMAGGISELGLEMQEKHWVIIIRFGGQLECPGLYDNKGSLNTLYGIALHFVPGSLILFDESKIL